MSMNPPQYTLAQVFFSLSMVLIIARTGWWISFEAKDTSTLQSVVFCFIVFGSVGALWYAGVHWVQGLRPKSRVDAVQPILATPHLAVQLIVDSWSAKGDGTFHLTVENIGEVQVDGILGRYRSLEMLDAELDAKALPKTLPPRGKLSFDIGPVNDLKRNRILFFDLTYQVTTGEAGQRKFTSRYHFSLPEGSFKPPYSLDPDQWQEETGNTIEKETKESIQEQMLQPQGTIFIVLPEVNEDGAPNFFAIRNSRRRIEFNPRTRKAVFQVGTTKPVETSFIADRVHVIVVRWSDMDKFADIKVDVGGPPH
jgi:hypothetical protein